MKRFIAPALAFAAITYGGYQFFTFFSDQTPSPYKDADGKYDRTEVQHVCRQPDKTQEVYKCPGWFGEWTITYADFRPSRYW